MIAAACLTLAAVHLPVWWRNRERRETLAFSMAAVCTAAIAGCELLMLKAQTADAYAAAQRWAHVPVALLLFALAAFGYHYLGAGRPWLALTGLAMRGLSLLLNFTVGVNLNYREISSLRSMPLLGEAVSVPVGIANPWVLLGQAAILVLTVFLVDATVTAWRRGRRAAAFFVGGSLVAYMLAGVTQGMLLTWQLVVAPSTVSLFSVGVVLVMGYALSIDLLRSKQLAIQLRDREQEAALAADAANLGIWTRDMARDAIWASDKWRELFAFDADEALNIERLLRRLHPDDRPTFAATLAKAAEDRQEYHAELRVVLPGGRLRWIAAMGRVEFDARDRAVRTRGAAIDITPRKQAEQEMFRLRQEIAHVGRVSVMGQLASALAHEISQPLGAILRNAEAATLFLQEPSPDLAEINAIVDDIRRDDQRAGAVIDRMRALLRRQDVETVPIDVAQVLGDVAALLRPDALARHVKIELDVPADLPLVLGDRVQLQQVLLNLILNGMDALEGVDRDDPRVSVGARRDGAQAVEISVADTGCGIAAAEFERIFDPFFSTKAKGIGMGLSISRSIVESHRGRLWAENRPGAGATFRFTLPIAAKAA